MNSHHSVIKSAQRSFEMLEFFDTIQEPVTLKHIASNFSYPISSASALLKSMVYMGYIEYDRYSRTYMPTMRLANLGKWVESTLFGETNIVQLTRSMSVILQETVVVFKQSDLLAQDIYVLPSTSPHSIAVRTGATHPLTHSGAGWLLLSTRSDSDVQLLLRRLNALQDCAKVDIAESIQRIKVVRSAGYHLAPYSRTPDVGILGQILPTRKHGRIFGVGIVSAMDRLIERKVELVTTIKRQVRECLD